MKTDKFKEYDTCDNEGRAAIGLSVSLFTMACSVISIGTGWGLFQWEHPGSWLLGRTFDVSLSVEDVFLDFISDSICLRMSGGSSCKTSGSI